MTRLFVDAEIVMDLLTQRENFFITAAELFTLGDENEVEINVSALTIANVFYLLSRQYNNKRAWGIVQHFRTMVNVLAVDAKSIDLALASEFKDFEDAIQYYVATGNSIGTLITRNLKDYTEAKIPVMTAESYLKLR